MPTGARRNFLLRLFVFICPIIVWLVWMAYMFNGLDTRPAMDNAQAARHLANGDGWVTSVVRPLSLVAAPRLDNHPDLVNPPLFKLITSALFKADGDKAPLAALASGLGWILCGWLIYLFTSDLTGRRRAGLLAFGLWVVHVKAAHFSILAENVTWSAAILTAILWAHTRAERHRHAVPEEVDVDDALSHLPLMTAAASGVLAGLFGLMEPALLWVAWLPLILYWIRWAYRTSLPDLTRIYYSSSIKRDFAFRAKTGYVWRLLAVFLLPALLLVLPWFAWVWAVCAEQLPTGLRLYSAMANSDLYPGDSIYRYAVKPPDNAFTFWLLQIKPVLRDSLKVLPQLPEMWLHLAGILPAILLVMSFFTSSGTGIRALRTMTGWMLLASVIFFNLLSLNSGYFLIFLPAVLILGVAGLDQQMQRWPDITPRPRRTSRLRHNKPGRLALALRFLLAFRRPLTAALVLLLAALPLVNLRLHLPRKMPMTTPPGLTYIFNHGTDADVLLTDEPWLAAWYGHRKAVWFPQKAEGIDTIMERGIRFDWVYIVFPPMPDKREIGDWWMDIIRHKNTSWKGFRQVQAQFPMEIVLRNHRPSPPLSSTE